jgi:hypothetical protein
LVSCEFRCSELTKEGCQRSSSIAAAAAATLLKHDEKRVIDSSGSTIKKKKKKRLVKTPASQLHVIVALKQKISS